MDNNQFKLKIFDGSKTPDDFIDDLKVFLSLNNNTKRNIIRKTFTWYPKESIDEEWNKWKKGKTKEKINQLTKSLRLILFIMRTGLIKRFSNEQFINELKTIGFDSDIIRYFVSDLDKNRENLVKRVEKMEKPLLIKLEDFEWRIDLKKSSIYSKKINELCIILKMSFSEKKNDDVVLELTSEELNSFVETLSLIQKEVIKFEEEEEK